VAQRPNRNIWRAVLNTPLVFAFAVFIILFFEGGLNGPRSDIIMLAWGSVIALIISYICCIFCVPVYFLVRNTKLEHPVTPVSLSFVIGLIFTWLFNGFYVSMIEVGFLISIIISGFVFWRFYAGRWWV